MLFCFVKQKKSVKNWFIESKYGLHHDSFRIFSHAEDSVRYQSSLKDALATHPTLRYSRVLNKSAGTLISTVEKFSTGTLI